MLLLHISQILKFFVSIMACWFIISCNSFAESNSSLDLFLGDNFKSSSFNTLKIKKINQQLSNIKRELIKNNGMIRNDMLLKRSVESNISALIEELDRHDLARQLVSEKNGKIFRDFKYNNKKYIEIERRALENTILKDIKMKDIVTLSQIGKDLLIQELAKQKNPSFRNVFKKSYFSSNSSYGKGGFYKAVARKDIKLSPDHIMSLIDFARCVAANGGDGAQCRRGLGFEVIARAVGVVIAAADTALMAENRRGSIEWWVGQLSMWGIIIFIP